jgi:CheY-like chemotaxis protein
MRESSKGDSVAILVAEDDAGIRTLIATLLRRAGYEVEAVTNGDAALSALQSRSFKVALIDLLMPRTDGYMLIDRVAELAPEFLACVIVITAVPLTSIEHLQLDQKVFRVMSKPFDLDELLETVASCANRTPFGQDESDFLSLRASSEAAHAKAGVVGLRRGPESLTIIWAYGYEPEQLADFKHLPINDRTPMGRSVLKREPVWVASREVAAVEFPHLVSILETNGTSALAAAPIMIGNHCAGSVAWSFSESQNFEQPQRDTLLRIANEYAMVMASHSHDAHPL